jgi:cytochrome c-type biogenesis protein CcmH
MVARYGDYVLLKPPFKADTWLLWLGAPLVLLLAGGGLLVAARRRRTIEAPPAALTDKERARVADLLGNREP